MTLDQVVETLRQNGIDASIIRQYPTGGEIKINPWYSLSVDDGIYCVTYEDDDHTLCFAQPRRKLDDAILDARMAIKASPKIS